MSIDSVPSKKAPEQTQKAYEETVDWLKEIRERVRYLGFENVAEVQDFYDEAARLKSRISQQLASTYRESATSLDRTVDLRELRESVEKDVRLTNPGDEDGPERQRELTLSYIDERIEELERT